MSTQDPVEPQYAAAPFFELLCTSADLSFAAVQAASQELGPAGFYRMHISRLDMDGGLGEELLAHFNRAAIGQHASEFRRLSVSVDARLPPRSWYLEANGRRLGSWFGVRS